MSGTYLTPDAAFTELQDGAALQAARTYAKYTIPSLVPRQVEVGTRESTRTCAPSIGATLVNNLVAKLVDLLFPVQTPFFSLSFSPEMIKRIQDDGLISQAEAEDRLVELARAAKRRLDANQGRARMMLALSHLIIAGNCAIHRDQKANTLRVLGMGNFVVQRDNVGLVIQAVVKEQNFYKALPPDIKEALAGTGKSYNDRSKVDMYQWIDLEWKPKQAGYRVSYWVDSVQYKSSEWYPEKTCPWFFPVCNLIPGEHYGRGYVEHYGPDFQMLAELSAAQLSYALKMLEVRWFADPASGTRIDDLAKSVDGSVLSGAPNMVAPVELPGGQKLAVVMDLVQQALIRLQKPFMYTGEVRAADRVTAYELQRDDREAGQLLGGVYSTLASEVQEPLAYLLVTEVDKAFEVHVISGNIQASVVTGSPALGASTEVDSLLEATQQIAAAIPVAQLDARVDSKRVVDVILRGKSIPPSLIMYTPEEQRANEEAAAAQQQAQAAQLEASTAVDQAAALGQVLGQ